MRFIVGFPYLSTRRYPVQTTSEVQTVARSIHTTKRDAMDFLGIEKVKLLLLNRTLYGMCDSGDYWTATLGFHIFKKLE